MGRSLEKPELDRITHTPHTHMGSHTDIRPRTLPMVQLPLLEGKVFFRLYLEKKDL